MDIKEQLDKLQKAANNWCNQKDADAKMKWIRKRAEQYSKKLKKSVDEVIAIWESRRDFSFMNYYQDCYIPDIDKDNVILQSDWIQQIKDRFGDIENAEFVCSNCGHVQKPGEFLKAGLDINDAYFCCASRFPELHYKNDKCKWTMGGFWRLNGTLVLSEDTLKSVLVFNFANKKK